MDFKNLLPAKNRDELRQWLSENYNKESECWVVVKRGRPVDNGTFWYIDAVEEAMCFGWIDSTTKKMDNGITAQRLAPRRKGSLWSELNKERCRRYDSDKEKAAGTISEPFTETLRSYQSWNYVWGME